MTTSEQDYLEKATAVYLESLSDEQVINLINGGANIVDLVLKHDKAICEKAVKTLS